MEQPIRRKTRRKKKTINAKQLLISAGCVIGAVALIIAACLIFGGKEKEEEPVSRIAMPALTVGEASRKGQSWVVETSYLDVALPYAFSDYIYVTAANEGTITALDFYVRTANMDEKLYTISFNASQGELVGHYDPKDGMGAVPVTVAFYPVPAGLSEDDRGTFFATQETFNDALTSMKEDPAFS